MPTEGTGFRRFQCLERRLSLAGFQVTIIVRFWVTAEDRNQMWANTDEKAFRGTVPLVLKRALIPKFKDLINEVIGRLKVKDSLTI
jgi:hypothetical protein